MYDRAAAESRTRELLDVLAAADGALTPDEVAARMRPGSEGSRVSRGSVRAAIRNARRIEKRLREGGQLDREVLIVDYSAYATEGANRYTLGAEDKVALLRENSG